jgi:hypothetical protein
MAGARGAQVAAACAAVKVAQVLIMQRDTAQRRLTLQVRPPPSASRLPAPLRAAAAAALQVRAGARAF